MNSLDSEILSSISALDRILDLYDDDDGMADDGLYRGFQRSSAAGASHVQQQSTYSLAVESVAKAAERNLLVRRPASVAGNDKCQCRI